MCKPETSGLACLHMLGIIDKLHCLVLSIWSYPRMHRCILSEGMQWGAINSVEYEMRVYGNKLNMNMHK